MAQLPQFVRCLVDRKVYKESIQYLIATEVRPVSLLEVLGDDSQPSVEHKKHNIKPGVITSAIPPGFDDE